jgi:hypothetical protein
MTDSTEHDSGDTRASERAPRIEQVERWAEYIESEPAGVWGPQQNAIVDG